MSPSNKLALLSILASRALASPQFYFPSSIQAQINSIFPTGVSYGGNGATYFSVHPAAYSTFISRISSFEAANPTYFNFASGVASQQNPQPTGIPNIGLSPTQSAELISAVSEFAAPVTGNPYAYISQHPGAFSSYIAEVSSIIGSDITRLSIPTGAGGIGGVGGGAGLPTAPIFTMSTSGVSRGAASVQSTAANSQITSQTTQLTTQQTTQQQQQQTASQSAAAQSSTTGGSGANGASLQTPSLVLGFSGVAIAAVAGMAAFL